MEGFVEVGKQLIDAQAQGDGSRPCFTDWPFAVHLVSDILDLCSFIVWLSDADVLNVDGLKEPAAYVIVFGCMVPVIGYLLEHHSNFEKDQARKLYISAEFIFDLTEVAFVSFAKQNEQVKEKHFMILVMTMLVSAMDMLIIKGPEMLETFTCVTFPTARSDDRDPRELHKVLASHNEAEAGNGPDSPRTPQDYEAIERKRKQDEHSRRLLAELDDRRRKTEEESNLAYLNKEERLRMLRGHLKGQKESLKKERLECHEGDERMTTEVGLGFYYTGQWKGDVRHGYGVLEKPAGMRYEGNFVNGQVHGCGKFKGPDGNTYDGQWDKFQMHGFGEHIELDFGTYEGEWAKNKKSGRGIQVYNDGGRYEGQWLQGDKHGAGVYTGPTGVEYDGHYENDKLHGKGRCTWADGRAYSGQWLYGLMHGQGRMTHASGSEYKGGFREDQKHGEGILMWPDGQVYTGTWNYGNPNGDGILVDVEGIKTKQQWVNGVRTDGQWINGVNGPGPGTPRRGP